MSTNSRIAVELPDGKIKSIYCHWDGYPSNNGEILLNHYQNVDKIKELINLGGLSCLKQNIKPLNDSHTFDKPNEDCVIAYNRDSCNELVIDEYNTLSEWSVFNMREEWNYIFRKGEWYFQGSRNKIGHIKLKKLTKKHLTIDG